jgi:hypothetical protein
MRPFSYLFCVLTWTTPALLSGCATGEPASDSANATAATKFIALGRTTPAQTVEVFKDMFERQLGEVLEAHPDIALVSKDNLSELTHIANVYYLDLQEVLELLLAHLGADHAEPAALEKLAPEWALSLLAPRANADGFWKPEYDGELPLMLLEAGQLSEEKNALAAAKKPAGVDLAKLRADWRAVEQERDTLDSSFVLPVRVTRTPTSKELRKHFGYGSEIELTATGSKAVALFAEADEGPGGSEAFAPIAKALAKKSIKKRWLFTGASWEGDGWSHHALIVLDEHKQLWGFTMGYSE